MPFYEYKCGHCGTVFDLMRRMAERDEPTTCPKCGKQGARRELPRVMAKVVGDAPCGAPSSACGAGGNGGFT